jgi:hypothetical protein
MIENEIKTTDEIKLGQCQNLKYFVSCKQKGKHHAASCN